MNDLALLIDLHRDGPRQGPGDDDATRLAITLAGLREKRGLRIADIGCGTGAATLVLARELDAVVTAVDCLADFVSDLADVVQRQQLGERIEPLVATMEALPFAEQSLDAVWSEGAVYNMGFARGIRAWRRCLKPAGILAVSELTWLTRERPAELARHWALEYPEVATASTKMALLEDNGYAPVGYFALPRRCWLDNYYRPLQARFAAFLARHGNATAARTIVAAEQKEIALYERFADYVGYGFYIAQRTTA
ncbi:MAG: class I SAM-dependent methyltransferase [Gammaproteobacteria bacterium]